MSGHTLPPPPAWEGWGGKNFRKVFTGEGRGSEIFILVREGGKSHNFEVKIQTA